MDFLLQRRGIMAHYWRLDATKSAALDLLCYLPVTDSCGDPAVWPRWAKGWAAAELFICLTPSQPVMEGGGGGLNEHKEICVGVEGGGHLGKADKGGPSQAETDPSFTL